MVKSIFELEKRTDLKKECIKIDKYLHNSQFSILDNSYQGYSFWDMVNSFFEFWPYRYTATNIAEFFDLYELPFEVEKMNNEQYFYYLQLIVDIILWLDEQTSYDRNSIEYQLSNLKQNNDNCFITILRNISLIADLSNYRIAKIEKHYTFIKRDSDVDSILSIIENEDDLRLALLEYNDFRIENDIKEKRIILKKLGDYIEPQRKKLASYNKSLTDDVFFMLNKFYIRHNNEGNITLINDDEYILWYDKLYKMIIQLIRTEYINAIHKDLVQYKT